MKTQCLILSAILFSLSAVTASAATFQMMKTKISMEPA
ncbi:hypothetical protein MELA_00921 [Candidatus Methylomirabilis lanthanidiphila]|uniref:Uncharacterized protein n=1 Tax=Candidatus Methylomirabilis lanthanidiphila TaxID=2211376 RepID=A0A564ZJ32_9BACT|nr:hypothetical protein MELA_00921 [Candidatus Methylomirabilis lanthanidiphila]